ncbi:MAG: hypothetical protein ACE5IP_07070 [Terriglobia bacterium]
MRASRIVCASALLLLCAGAAQAGTNYHALIIRSVEPLDSVLVEKFKINGKDKFYRLEGTAPLSKDQYKRLRKFSFSEVYSFQVEKSALRVRTHSGLEVFALPENFKKWPKGSLEGASVVRGSRIKARILNTKRSFSAPPVEGWVIYLFPREPSNDTVAFTLAEVQNTEASWVEFLQRFPGSRHAPTAREQLAPVYTDRASQALSRFQEALRERKPGYRYLGEARQWFNRLRSLKVETPALSQVEATLTKLEGDLDQRLRQARTLAEGSQFKVAQEALEPLLHFRAEYPELDDTYEDILLQGARYHLAQARQRLAQAEFDEALRELESAASYRESSEIPALREEVELQRAAHQRQEEIQRAVAQAREATGRNDFAAAFDALWPVARRYPEDTALQENFSAVQEVYREALLAEVAKAEKLHAPIHGPGDEAKLLQLRRDLARLDQTNPFPALEVWRDRLGLHLADYYRHHADEIADQKDYDLTALAFAYLQQARRFLLDKAEIKDFPARRQGLEQALQIRLALRFRDLTPGASGEYIVAELAALMASTIQDAGFPHVDIVEARREEAPQLTLELIVELLRAAVRDEEPAQPIASEYSAGFRQVPNPAWRDAKSAYDQAVENYERVRTRVEKNRRQKKYEKKEREADEEALRGAQEALRKANQALDAVPSFVEKEDIRRYEFTRRKWTRTAEIRLSYRWVNARTGVREAQEILEERASESGVGVTGVHPADKHGHRNQPPDPPEPATLRGRALKKIQQKLAERVLDHLGKFVGRDFEQARRELQRGNNEMAAEHYLRFLFNSAPDDTRRQQAFEYLQGEFRLVSLADWLPVPEED